MPKKPDIQELLQKIQNGELTLDDIPPEMAQYAASEMPDLDQEFFKHLCNGFGVQQFLCPFCRADDWKVGPLFGAFMSIRSYGPKGVHATPEVYARVECTYCSYTLLFNVRKGLERMVKEAEEKDVQMSGMREEHGAQRSDAEEDPSEAGDGCQDGTSGDEHPDGDSAV